MTSDTCTTLSHGTKAIQTNKKESNIIEEVMKQALNFQKGHFRASNRQKNICILQPYCIFLSVSVQIYFS